MKTNKHSFFFSCVEASLKKIDSYLLSAGFSIKSDVPWERGRICRPFVRSLKPWKSDMINVLYPKSAHALADTEFLIGLRITLSGKDDAAAIYYDGVDLAYLVGKKSQNYAVPQSAIFEARTRASFAGELVFDIEQALPWFEARSTIEACISLLKEGKTNAGSIQESGAALRALQVLESWDPKSAKQQGK